MTIEEEEEAQERCAAELEFVSAAYSPKEAWVITTGKKANGSSSSSSAQIHRLLLLPIEDNGNNSGNTTTITTGVELILTMPIGYPVDESCTLLVEATIVPDEQKMPESVANERQTTTAAGRIAARKIVLDALPHLLSSCRSISEECAGGEAVFAVLGRADEWIEHDWVDIQTKIRQQQQQQNDGQNDSDRKFKPLSSLSSSISSSPIIEKEEVVVLGRRLIYSHHIIANSKRKAIADLASQYNLGGYAKIGWPGIIVIEGNEQDCISYVEEIKTMRWQHLTVRGEEQERVRNLEELQEQRKLSNKFEELGEDQMSTLAGLCRDVGLENLFLTSMKIYRNDKVESSSSSPAEVKKVEVEETVVETQRYGALVHVDHMNDAKKYQKWLQRACKDADCSLFLKRCSFSGDDDNESSSSNSRRRVIILVGLVGNNEAGVKKVLKRWRISKVDVDSRGKPCLERMMTVLEEGKLDHKEETMYAGDSSGDCAFDTDDDRGEVISTDKMKNLLGKVGGENWSNSFVQLLSQTK